MNIVKTVLVISTLYSFSFGSFAQSISATGSTPDGAESQITQKAKQAGPVIRFT